MTPDQLRAVCPHLHEAKAAEYLPHLEAAMAGAEITTSARQAAFLAQLAHESGEFRWMEERDHAVFIPECVFCRVGPHPAGAQYEGRHDLGNTQPGDGVRYKGRGPIQLTGRANYRTLSCALFPGQGSWSGKGPGLSAAFAIDTSGPPETTFLEEHPERVADPDVGFRAAAWFWSKRSLNAAADVVDGSREAFDRITRAINGGMNGADQRWAYYLRALEALTSTRPYP